MRPTTKRAACAAIGVMMSVSAVACGDETSDVDEQVADSVVAGTADAIEVLTGALQTNGLDSVATAVASIDMSSIVGSDEFTFFAPNNDAFFAVDAEDLAQMLSDSEQVARLLRNHTVASVVTIDNLTDGSSIETVSGRTLEVTVADGEVTVGGVTVVDSDILAGDEESARSVVHVVDGLIIE